MLSDLSLENFRNHRSFKLSLDKITVLIGSNGAGKSNILEALVLLSFCRSFREEDKKNLINFESVYARIKGDELEVFLTREPRFIMQAKHKGVPKKLTDFVGTLPSVVFSPETLSVITGSPSERRRFLDIMISQVDREYLLALTEYKKVRAQRNVLLEKIAAKEASVAELDFWDRELVKNALIIRDRRREIVAFLNQSLSTLYKEISGDKKEELKILYQSNFNDLLEDLVQNRFKELRAKRTLYGPHRDNLLFLLQDKDMSSFASRGEIRSAILSLKISEISFIEAESEKTTIKKKVAKPLLLLDDVFSEFDPDRRAHLGQLILNYQTVITSTEREHLSVELLKNASVVELK